MVTTSDVYWWIVAKALCQSDFFKTYSVYKKTRSCGKGG